MKKTITLLSALLISTTAMAGTIERSITIDKFKTPNASVELFLASDKLQIVGEKVDGKQTCWVEAFKGEQKFTSETISTTRHKFKSNPLKNCISKEDASNLLKS